MPKSPKLWLLVLLVALAGTVVVFVLSDDPEQLPVGRLPDAAPVEQAAPINTAEDKTAPAAYARETVDEVGAGIDAAAAELDPEIRAALAGFKGRVVHHDGEPVPGTRVLLYRFDADAVIGDDLVLAGIISKDVALELAEEKKLITAD